MIPWHRPSKATASVRVRPNRSWRMSVAFRTSPSGRSSIGGKMQSFLPTENGRVSTPSVKMQRQSDWGTFPQVGVVNLSWINLQLALPSRSYSLESGDWHRLERVSPCMGGPYFIERYNLKWTSPKCELNQRPPALSPSNPSHCFTLTIRYKSNIRHFQEAFQ